MEMKIKINHNESIMVEQLLMLANSYKNIIHWMEQNQSETSLIKKYIHNLRYIEETLNNYKNTLCIKYQVPQGASYYILFDTEEISFED